MGAITENPTRAYLHCRNAVCPGYEQVEVDGVRVETAQTFGDNGGDGIFVSFVERSMVTYRAADESVLPCPACGTPREVTGDPRMSYQPLSGFDPMGLLNVPRFDPNQAPVVGASLGESDEEIEARLRAKLREEAIEARLRAEMAEEG